MRRLGFPHCEVSRVPVRCAVKIHAATSLSALSLRRAAIERLTTLKSVRRAHAAGRWPAIPAISSMRVLRIRGIGMLMATMPGARLWFRSSMIVEIVELLDEIKSRYTAM